MAMRFHHVQVSYPDGAEGSMREFYVGVLGLTEVTRPASLGTVGAWFRDGEKGAVEIHCSMEDAFRPSPKAHPCLAVDDVDRLAAAVESAGIQVIWDARIPGVRRFYARDPAGNRWEFQQG